MAKKKDEQVDDVVNSETVYIDPQECWHCKRRGTEFRCAKGDRNQYRFCSIECHNKDKTV